ncbi:hypothetical protein ACOME3_002208 [Neoechinorhynchus agilis]
MVSSTLSPGQLTDLRSSLVNNNLFAYIAVRFGFQKYIRANSARLLDCINTFVYTQTELKEDYVMDDEFWVYEEDIDAAGNEGSVTMLSEVPKCLSDIFEAVAGAIFVDSKFSFETVWRIYKRMLDPFISKFVKEVPVSPVRRIYELCRGTCHFKPVERLLNGQYKCTLVIAGTDIFRGIGRSFKTAKAAAARSALKHFESNVIECA